MSTGRFAPSPTGRLHLGNLRTAVLAWLMARSSGSRFVLRMEDLDLANSSVGNEEVQKWELAQLGLDWDGPILRQSERFGLYEEHLDRLSTDGLTYPCFCSRKDIAQAASAPHGAPSRYPRTCSTLNSAQQNERALTRPAAIRMRSSGTPISFTDHFAGTCEGVADDVVIKRNDGVPAYNLAVVVDDDAQGVDEVIRGADLLESTFTQIELANLLGVSIPTYGHIGLVTDSAGERLAKRHGSITIEERIETGDTPMSILNLLTRSLGIASEATTLSEALEGFDPDSVPTENIALID